MVLVSNWAERLHLAGGSKLDGKGLYDTLVQRLVPDPCAVKVTVEVALAEIIVPVATTLLNPKPIKGISTGTPV